MVQRFTLGVLALQDPPFEPVWKCLGELIMHVRARRDGKDIVEFLEGPLLGFRHPEEDHDEGGDVEESVEAEGALRLKGRQHLREGDGQGRGPEQTGRHRPTHADLTVRQGEYLGRIRERYGTFAGRVERREDEDEKGDESEVSTTVFGDPEAEAGSEERPCHIGEGEEQERPASVGVNGPHRGPSKNEIHETKAPGSE